MRSRSFNVIYITFGCFTLLDHFVSYLKYLPAPKPGGSLPSSAHNLVTFTLKPRPKPTRQGRRGPGVSADGTPEFQPRRRVERSISSKIGGRQPHSGLYFDTFSGRFGRGGRSRLRPGRRLSDRKMFWGSDDKTGGPRPSNCHSTSSGSVPATRPSASVVILSTRASACRSNSSHRRFKASPRS
jgi:hypothetical protein